MDAPDQNNTLYKLDASFSEVHRNRLEFTSGPDRTPQKPLQAASSPNLSLDIRLVPASEIPLPPAPSMASKPKSSVRFPTEIKVDYFFYPDQSVDQPVRMRREIYDDDEGVLLYYLEVCEEGFEKMKNIPGRTIRCQINGKKGMVERLKKEKQHQEELELAGYGYYGGTEAGGMDITTAVPINHKMKDKLVRLREELKEELLLTPAELEITRKTAENTKINTGAIKDPEELRELEAPRASDKRGYLTPSSLIPPSHEIPENASDRNLTEDQRKGARVAEASGRKPGDPLRMPDDIPKTASESDITQQKRVPKSTKSGPGTEKPLKWDEYLKAKGGRPTTAEEKRRALGGSCLNLLRPFFSTKKTE